MKKNTYRLNVRREHVDGWTTDVIVIVAGTTPGNAELQIINLFNDDDTWVDTMILKTVKLEGAELQLLFQI